MDQIESRLEGRRMEVLGLRGIVFATALLLAQSQDRITKPQVTPAFLEEKAPAFLLQCANTTGTAIRPMPVIMLRIDGQVQPVGGYGTAGPQPPLIAPGDSWKEIAVLHTSRSATARSPSFGAVLRRDISIESVGLTTGRHTVEFQCGGAWSDDTAFYWDDGRSEERRVGKEC